MLRPFYKLTTKELQSDMDLNWYDFDARMQDEQIGRWTSVDPLAEKNNYQSPYQYADNNPAMIVDPDGKDGRYSINGNTITLSTTVYVLGEGNAGKAKDYQEYFDKMKGNLTSTIKGKDEDGNEVDYTFKVEVSYKAGDDNDRKKIEDNITQGTPTGDNFITLNHLDENGKPFQTRVFNDALPKYDPSTGGRLRQSINTINVHGMFGTEYYSEAHTAVHETLHMLGLQDKCDYTPKAGF